MRPVARPSLAGPVQLEAPPASSLFVTGGGLLELTGDNSAFLGTSTVANNTKLVVNTNPFGGSVVVNGTLAGNSTITGERDRLRAARLIAPQREPALIIVGTSCRHMAVPTTLNIGGNYVQLAGGTYRAIINGAGQSDFLNVTGSATLNGILAVHAPAGTTYAPARSCDHLARGRRRLGHVRGVYQRPAVAHAAGRLSRPATSSSTSPRTASGGPAAPTYAASAARPTKSTSASA